MDNLKSEDSKIAYLKRLEPRISFLKNDITKFYFYKTLGEKLENKGDLDGAIMVYKKTGIPPGSLSDLKRVLIKKGGRILKKRGVGGRFLFFLTASFLLAFLALRNN